MSQLIALQLDERLLIIAIINSIEKNPISTDLFSFFLRNNRILTSIIEYYYDNNQKEKAIKFFKFLYNENLTEKGLFSSELLIQIIDNVKTEREINNRLRFINNLTDCMNALTKYEVYNLFTRDIRRLGASGKVDFLLKFINNEKTLLEWILTFLKSPSKEWLTETKKYEEILVRIKTYLDQKKLAVSDKSRVEDFNLMINYSDRWIKLYKIFLYISKTNEKALSEIRLLLKTLSEKDYDRKIQLA